MTLEELPFTSLQSIILTTGPLVFLWTYSKRFVEKHGALKWVETLYETHNFLVASVSLVLAAYILDIGHDILTAKTGYQVEPATLAYLYHLLKIYEYFDILFMVFSGNVKISKYTAFTHLALPYWSYYRVVKNNTLDWRFQVITDCFVRFLSRAVPWLTEDARTEEIMLSMAEEWRWYPDLVIAAFFAMFVIQDKRESEDAVRVFGAPQKDENTARMMSVAVLLYASYTKRQESIKNNQPAKINDVQPASDHNKSATSTSADSASSSQTLRKARGKR